MSSLQDIINLSKADGGKFFVIDEKGEAKLVIMAVEEYQRLLLGKLQKQILDVEKINKEIIQAQLHEQEIPKPQKPPAPLLRESPMPRFDLRSEVIDPSFDFEAPKTEIDDL